MLLFYLKLAQALFLTWAIRFVATPGTQTHCISNELFTKYNTAVIMFVFYRTSNVWNRFLNELRYGTWFIPVLWHCFLAPNMAGIVWMSLSVTAPAGGAPQATTEALSPAETGTCSSLRGSHFASLFSWTPVLTVVNQTKSEADKSASSVTKLRICGTVSPLLLVFSCCWDREAICTSKNTEH